MSVEEMWCELRAMGISEQTLQIITDINGYSAETMRDVLYAAFGDRFFTDELEFDD